MGKSEGLEAIPLFAALSEGERERLALVVRRRRYKQGDVVTKEGAIAFELFAIEAGTASVDHRDEHLADLGPGDFFGEIASMDHGRRRASVVATTPVRAIVMTAHDLRVLAHELPAVEARIRDAIASRTQRLN